MSDLLPRRIRVAQVISSRYLPGERPISWDDRAAGLELVKTDKGEEVRLYSSGGQSSPGIAWELLLVSKVKTSEKADDLPAYAWTLYGIGQSPLNT